MLRIREARKHVGLSQEQLAEKLGTTNQHVSQWETGQRGLSVRQLFQLSDALSIEPAALLATARSTECPTPDRPGEPVRESDLPLPALRFLAAAPGGFLETRQLIAKLEALFKPTGGDAEIIAGRADTHFSQKVRNLISHRESTNNPIKKGWIDYHPDRRGLTITRADRAILEWFTFEPTVHDDA